MKAGSGESGIGNRKSAIVKSGTASASFSYSRFPIPDSRLHGPQRIVCLTEEPTETLYLLGEQERIVGISGFTVRPPIARREKPKVSAFTSAKIGEILKLEPDFVIGVFRYSGRDCSRIDQARCRSVDQQSP